MTNRWCSDCHVFNAEFSDEENLHQNNIIDLNDELPPSPPDSFPEDSAADLPDAKDQHHQFADDNMHNEGNVLILVGSISEALVSWSILGFNFAYIVRRFEFKTSFNNVVSTLQSVKWVSSGASQLWGWLKSVFDLDINLLDLGGFGAAEIAGANPIVDPGEDVFMDVLVNMAWAVCTRLRGVPVSKYGTSFKKPCHPNDPRVTISEWIWI
ncbi:unnamed protein product [Allacma fusca]|uniref:Uncharacterized protein n=1 Tax=Allacma fusca TaxID=39272 RepID=A0A8J2LNX9_9HEXA|nr:unnamed protein product [Allacma fusca]